MKLLFLSAIPALVLAASPAYSQTTDELILIAKKELQREIDGFKSIQPAPYYLAYRIGDEHRASISSSFGSLTNADTSHYRELKAIVRVGDYRYDNTHVGDDQSSRPFFFNFYGGTTPMPLENDERPIRHQLWRATQSAYQSAKDAFQQLKDVKDAKISDGGDFSPEETQTSIDPPPPAFNTFYRQSDWTERVKDLTVPFRGNDALLEGQANLSVELTRTYFISSEGTVIAQNRSSAYLFLRASVRTSDGDVAPLNLSYFAFRPSDLPSNAKILSDIEGMMKKLNLLKVAARAEPYTGPAILYSRASGVFFHEIFGHRVEGHRLKDVANAQTFKGMLNKQVLPSSFSVISDPTLDQFKGNELNGFYKYDDEGIKSQKVTVVNHGVLKTFLMSRSPTDGLVHSNGHGRGATGIGPVSRQSNLIVVNEKPHAMKELRKMLVHECKKQKKEYGYLFMDVTGGFTTTDRYMPNAFNIFPTEVYRIYTDGRPDELVHGVNLIGTPLSMFAEIIAADDASEVFTGFCGAESGRVPVTAISPSIFVGRIETQKKIETKIELPLLSPPEK